jgi:hypothetical protein
LNLSPLDIRITIHLSIHKSIQTMSRHADSIRQQLGSGHALPGNWLKNRLKPADDIARTGGAGR